MEIMKWEPFREVPELRRRFDNLFDSLIGREVKGEWVPAIDVSETPDEILVKADIPGIEQKDLSITLSGENLIIKGERKSETEEKTKHSHRIERRYGSFERMIKMPVAVDAGKIKAKYENGVLEVHLPKKAEVKPKEIKIEVKE